MTQKYIGLPIVVTAVQWIGANLRELQELLAPESPLAGAHCGAIGIEVTKLQLASYEKPGTAELKFAEVGDWIVLTPDVSMPLGRRVAVVSNQEFAERFTPSDSITVDEYNRGQQAAALKARAGEGAWDATPTHPLAVEPPAEIAPEIPPPPAPDVHEV